MKTIMTSIINIMNEKNHVVEFKVQPVKLLGITIRRGYTVTQFIKCECGESARERFIKSMNKPNAIFQKLKEKVQ